MPEVVEFGLAAGADNGWSAAKLVTRLIWMYDPLPVVDVRERALKEYMARYPKLTTAFVCNFLLVE